jgi:acetoacetyl-CoA synthetase
MRNITLQKMKKEPLWTPSEDTISKANITRFIEFVNERFSLDLKSYGELYEWSVRSIPEFWGSVWDYVEIISSQTYEKVVEDLAKFPGTNWFIGSQLNFAENLLRFRDSRPALLYVKENGNRDSLSYSELYAKVGRLAESLRSLGLKPGDRVAAYMPNKIETIVAMLASASIGATWASCGAELGPTAVLDRVGQIGPKVLFTVDGYEYKGKAFSLASNVETVVDGVPSIEKVVVTENLAHGSTKKIDEKFVPFEGFLAEGGFPTIDFAQLPFAHPMYVMFSSGTTGKPKSIVQSAGGVLLNHFKELILHADLRRDDSIAFITSPSWMMWNWVVSALGVGSTLLLYDGDPNYPSWEKMWKIVSEEKVTIFGCSASYIGYLRSAGAKPSDLFDLTRLREIPQTGSSLSKEGFEWVYSCVKKDLHLNSISGGTDINGCFAGGCPILPVYSGEVQAPMLGMKIAAYDENGNPVLDKQGELVCEAPAPSMPLYFWNDPGNKRYLDAYFTYYAGKNVWRHGDYVVFHSDTGGLTFYGRSDAVLKPSGVRIGTAEIYNVIEKIPAVADSIAIGQSWKGDQRIILFVQLRDGESLSQEIKNTIVQSLRSQASPRHVPALIFEIPGIPYTFSGKKVEVAITNIVNGMPVTNLDAIANPNVLEYYKKLLPQIREQ